MRISALLFMLSLLVAGCSPPPSGQAASPASVQSSSIATLPASATLTPPATASPATLPTTIVAPTTVVALSPTSAAKTQEPPVVPPSPTATLAASPLPDEPFRTCAPIADIRLEDLPLLISDGYHPPADPSSDGRHPGIDIAFYNWQGYRQIAGAPVQSALPGRVAAAEVDTYPFGNLLIIETPARTLPAALRKKLNVDEAQSLYLLYAHMQADSLRVTLGEAVSPCETIGRVGKTGNSGQAHLHLETRLGPTAQQFIGLAYYTDEATQTQKDNYRRWATGGEFVHFDPLYLLLYEFGYTPTATPRRPWNY